MSDHSLTIDVPITFDLVELQTSMEEQAAAKIATHFITIDRDVFTRSVKAKVDEILSAKIMAILGKGVTPTDRFGNPTGPAKSFDDVIVEQLSQALLQKVTSEGKPTSDPYGALCFGEYLTRQHITTSIKNHVAEEARKLANAAKESLAKQVSEAVLSVVRK